MAVDVVVVIPCKNEAVSLPRQLAALNDQTDLNFRVVVSDNGSTDATVLIATNWAATFAGGIHVVDSSDKPGAAHARNVAMEASREPLILACDGDDQVHRGWVASMRAALATHDLATGPLHLYFPDSPGKKAYWNLSEVPVSMGFRPYAPSCNLGMRREVFETVGGFDDSLPLGQEDVDFGWRAASEGFLIGHAPDATIDYVQRPTTRSLLRQQWQYGQAHVLLYNKHRFTPGMPAPASNKTSIRWFWEWLKQLPRRVHTGEARDTFGTAVFQASRWFHSRRVAGSPL